MPTTHESSSHLPYLAQLLADGELILFAGAGVSLDAGLPGAWQLAEKLAHQIGYTPQPGDTLGMIAEYYDRALPGQLTTRLVDWLYTGRAPGTAHRLLVQLPWHTIYTTNYDVLIEAAYDAAGIAYKRVLYTQQQRGISNTSQTIIKLHGCLSDPYRFSREVPLVITDADYDLYLPHRQQLITRLKNALLDGKRLVFVGYGMGDRFWQDLHKDIRHVLGTHTIPYYAVMPVNNPHADAYWQARHIHILNYDATHFFNALIGQSIANGRKRTVT